MWRQGFVLKVGRVTKDRDDLEQPGTRGLRCRLEFQQRTQRCAVASFMREYGLVYQTKVTGIGWFGAALLQNNAMFAV